MAYQVDLQDILGHGPRIQIKDKRKNGVLSGKALKEIIMTPFHRLLHKRISFFFIMEGFFVEISTPGFGFKERQNKGVLNPKNNILVCPFIHPYDVPEFWQNIGIGMHKGFKKKTSTSIEPSETMAGLESLRKECGARETGGF